jgi:Tfp pilus assembly protein PilF
MIKRYIIVWLCIISVAANLPSFAQSSKLQQGIESFTKGSYNRALEYLTIAISQEKSLTGDMIAQAYYYRGLTYVRLYNEAFSSDDETSQKQYNEALLSAYNDYKASLSHDEGQLWKQIDLEVKALFHPLLQEGLLSLNKYNEQVFQHNPDPKLLERAEEYLVAAHEIRETYLVCDLLGQVYLDKGNKTDAAASFSKSEKLYSEKLPEVPDFLMAYVFYRLSAIHKSSDIRLALQDNQRGINLMHSEYDRFIFMKDKLPAGKATELEGQYKLAIKDLNNMKLDLYSGDDALYIEAIHVFEEEISQDTSNADLLTGYGSLLEKTDKAKAISVYQKALAIDSTNTVALFNTGALYYAKGKEMFETAQKTSENKQYNLLIKEADNYFRQARPYFEKALLLEPGSSETIQALKTIAFVLDDQDAYLKYQDMENKAGK